MSDATESKEGSPEKKLDNQEMSSCLVCLEPIRKGAQKCIHCDSYQDWRNRLSFGSTVLALVVALVSVLSLSIPILKEAFRTHNSRVSPSFQSVDRDAVMIVGSNLGTRPGSVSDVDIEVDISDRFMEFYWLLPAKSADRFLAPSASKQISFTPQHRADSALNTEFFMNIRNYTCVLHVTTREFDSTSHEYIIKSDCGRYLNPLKQAVGMPMNLD